MTQLVYEMMAEAEVGDTITYKAIGELIDRDPDEPIGLAAIRQTADRARKKLGAKHARSAMTICGVGYQIVNGIRHMGQAIVHSRKARTQVKRSTEILSDVDSSTLSHQHRSQLRRSRDVMAARLDMMDADDAHAQAEAKVMEELREFNQRRREERGRPDWT
ncbi:hypothetical protein ACMATS_05960 [Streptoverticillium reticulum]|uniref:hypothetical protein n=1 Tax=Streptoverticillium reticulum TaxID=1433415 RepID=UPI0039BF4DB4